jgi:hypothetical protein
VRRVDQKEPIGINEVEAREQLGGILEEHDSGYFGLWTLDFGLKELARASL